MYFASKKDVWLYFVNWGCILACLTPLFIGRDYEALFFTVPFAILITWSWFETGYKVDGDFLIIQSGPMKKKIMIKDIDKISRTKNPAASSALSLDRLEITCKTALGMALVSPKDQKKFTTVLKRMNPQIEIDKTI